MAKHNKIGVKGEEIGASFLLNKGYIILYKNYRIGKKELDIIAVHGDTLVIVEVKTRTGFDFGFPEEAVNRKKQQFLRDAAAIFINENPQYKNIRFDIISVLLDGDDIKEIIHFEEAFH